METFATLMIASIFLLAPMVGETGKEMETLVCTGQKRFVINSPGKKSVVLQRRAGYKTCAFVWELLRFTQTKSLDELLKLLNRDRKNFTFALYKNKDGGPNLLIVYGTSKK
jgi:hypothetical protein